MKFSCCSTRTHSVRKNYRIVFMIRRPRPFVNPAKSAKISKTLPPARQPMRSMLTNIFICRIMPDSMPFSGILTAKVQTFGSLSTFVTVQYLHTYRNLPRSFPSDAWQAMSKNPFQIAAPMEFFPQVKAFLRSAQQLRRPAESLPTFFFSENRQGCMYERSHVLWQQKTRWESCR